MDTGGRVRTSAATGDTLDSGRDCSVSEGAGGVSWVVLLVARAPHRAMVSDNDAAQRLVNAS